MMKFFRRRSQLPDANTALIIEFGAAWFFLLPQRILEAVWDGDNLLIVSDSRRLSKVLSNCAPPQGPVELQINFLHALYKAADRWTRVSHRDDPGSDLTRCGEVPIAVRELAETVMRQAALQAGGRGEAMVGWWMASAADLVVRCVRFRDGFAMPMLARELQKYPHLCRPADQPSPADAPTRLVPVMKPKLALPAGTSSGNTRNSGVRVSVHAGSGAVGLDTVSPHRHLGRPAPAEPVNGSSMPTPSTAGRHASPVGGAAATGKPQPVTDGGASNSSSGPQGPPVMPQFTAGSYLLHLALSASRIVNGVSEGARNAQECMQLIERRFGGQYPFATAMRAAMVAIRDGDQETLRELADMTAAAGEEDSPARVLHSLVLAGEKVLYDRAA